MATIIQSPEIAGVFVVTPDVYEDARGMFVETYRKEWIPAAREMVQANRADRCARSLVGLHYHLHQADYWYVPHGSARVGLHDLRSGSPTDGATLMLDLGVTADVNSRHRGVYIPAGVAHGFAALTDMTITYLVDGYYDPADELGVAYNDPAIAADWLLDRPILSERDSANPLRSDIAEHLMPQFSNA